MQQILVLNALLLSFLLGSCNSEKKMIKFYSKHEAEMKRIYQLSVDLTSRYRFKYASFRNMGKQIGIRLSVHDEHPYKGTGEYYNPKTLKPMEPLDLSSNICDSCTEEERKQYSLLINEDIIKEILKLYISIKPKAIQITANGVFFALGSPLQHPNKSEVEAGIIMAFPNRISELSVLKEIDSNVYLYEGVIH